jgi:hypothetical protein
MDQLQHAKPVLPRRLISINSGRVRPLGAAGGNFATDTDQDSTPFQRKSLLRAAGDSRLAGYRRYWRTVSFILK